MRRDEVELRARGNIALQANIDFMTLRQWYNSFNVTGTKEIYLKPPPGVKNGKGSSFCLELFIHEDVVSIHFPWKETNFELIIHYFHSTMNEQVRMKIMVLNTLPSGRQPRNGKGGDLKMI